MDRKISIINFLKFFCWIMWIKNIKFNLDSIWYREHQYTYKIWLKKFSKLKKILLFPQIEINICSDFLNGTVIFLSRKRSYNFPYEIVAIDAFSQDRKNIFPKNHFIIYNFRNFFFRRLDWPVFMKNRRPWHKN